MYIIIYFKESAKKQTKILTRNVADSIILCALMKTTYNCYNIVLIIKLILVNYGDYMTDKELKKLSRADLLEILIEQGKEIERLKEIIKKDEKKLQSKKIMLNEAGSIAEASLKVNQIFENAQKAADQYLVNIRDLKARQAELCIQMEKETQKKCNDMITKAKLESKAYWNEVSKKVDEYITQYAGLKDLLSTPIPNADEKSE